MRIQHLIQTRFSVRPRWGHYERFPRDWLLERLALFDQYCFPSVAAQTAEEFTWLLYCDESTDPEAMAELRERERALPQLQIALTGTIMRSTLPVIDRTCDALVTTRLDSDDGIHRRYVEAIQARAPEYTGDTWLVNFPRGYQLDHATGRLYLAWMTRSHFHTLFESPAEPRTVLSGNHSRFHEQHPTVQDDSLDAWVQVIHDGNVKNSLLENAWPADPSRLDGFAAACGICGWMPADESDGLCWRCRDVEESFAALGADPE